MQVLGEAAAYRKAEEYEKGRQIGVAAADNIGNAGKNDGTAQVGQRVSQGYPVDELNGAQLTANCE